jgi:MFS family permease
VSPGRRESALAPVLIYTTMVTAIISSLGAQLIPTIAEDLHVSLSTAQWSLTVTLLVGAVSSPVMGRLGDGPRRRETLIAGLAAVTLGGALAALASSLPLLVAGRALQGIGLGLMPLTMAAAREHLPRERVPATIALLSVCAAAGVGIGYPISGLIASGLGLSAAYWFGALVSGVALAGAFAIIPSSSHLSRAPLDVPGAALLTVGLVGLLLAITEGNGWGWTSTRVLALLAVAAGALVAWVFQQLHARAPLVELRLLRHRAMMAGNGCGIILAVAMYMYLTGVTEYIQTPEAKGYGFSASILVAGLSLVPFSVFSIAASRTLPLLTRLVGLRGLLPVGTLIIAAGGVFFALFHTALWQAFVMLGILGIGFGSTFAAIPGLIVRSVPESETGSAMGFYQVVRYIGFSLGSALAASILSSHTPAGEHLPTESGYLLLFWGGVAICLAGAVLLWLIPAGGSAPTPREQRFGEEDGELGAAGLVGLTRE